MGIIEVIRSGNFVVLDTETTGLRQAEICQIAIIDSSGKILLDTLIKPVDKIPLEASEIHGITDEMVVDCSDFKHWKPIIERLTDGKNVIVYNADFDRAMLSSSARAVGLEGFLWNNPPAFFCAMEAFAEIYGDWNDYHQSYRWQKLSTAANYYQIPQTEAHTALADCLVTLQVCKAMAAQNG